MDLRRVDAQPAVALEVLPALVALTRPAAAAALCIGGRWEADRREPRWSAAAATVRQDKSLWKSHLTAASLPESTSPGPWLRQAQRGPCWRWQGHGSRHHSCVLHEAHPTSLWTTAIDKQIGLLRRRPANPCFDNRNRASAHLESERDGESERARCRERARERESERGRESIVQQELSSVLHCKHECCFLSLPKTPEASGCRPPLRSAVRCVRRGSSHQLHP